MPGTVEIKDLAQLRQLNLELLRQLWARQDAMRRSVAKAASEVGAHLGNSQRMEEEGRATDPRPEPRPPGLSCAACPLLMRKLRPSKGRDWTGQQRLEQELRPLCLVHARQGGGW